ncbi:MAG: hypothetical protein V5A27_09980 [Halapricum sp.]
MRRVEKVAQFEANRTERLPSRGESSFMMPSRRRFLIGTGTAGIATLAGCLGGPEPRYVGESGEEPDTEWWPQPEFDRIASCYNPRPIGPREESSGRSISRRTTLEHPVRSASGQF